MTDSPTVSQGTVSANGLEFAYLEAGEGPLVLCLHGFPDTAWSWVPVVEGLAARGFRAVAPFLRGYAPTEVPRDGDYELATLIADAGALHEALGGGSDAVLIGGDWGGSIAYGSAAAYPERFRTIVPMATPPRSVILEAFATYDQLKRSWYPFFFQTPMAEMVFPLDDFAFIEGLWRDWSPGFDPTPYLPRVKDSVRDEANTHAAIEYYRFMLAAPGGSPRYDHERAAVEASWNQPTLYIHGAIDQCVPVGVVERAGERFGEHTRVEILDGVGHFPHIEAPETVITLVADWIDAH
jgi:pimeloyl-ACP methyl ester carboxylesterase